MFTEREREESEVYASRSITLHMHFTFEFTWDTSLDSRKLSPPIYATGVAFIWNASSAMPLLISLGGDLKAGVMQVPKAMRCLALGIMP